MAQVATSGGGGGTIRNGKWQKWGSDQKWAYFPKLPNGQRSQWVRVGSSRWKEINQHNMGASGGRSPRGQGTMPGHNTLHPTKFAKQAWNPASPEGRRTWLNKTTPRGGQGDQPGAAGGKGGQGFPGTAGAGTGHGQVNQQPAHHAGGPGTDPSGNGPAQQKAQTDALSRLIGNPNVQKMLPGSMAKNLANLQFGSQIRDTLDQMSEGKAQGAQDLADIANWYGTLKSQANAGQALNDTQTQHSANAMQAATQAALAAIGGSANSSAGAAASAGLAQQAAIQQQGQLSDNAHAALIPALGLDQASQMSAQTALNSQSAAALAQQLTDLQGQRGNARVQALQQIMAANNAARQSNYGNRVSKIESILGARQLMGNLKLQGLQFAQGAQALNQSGTKGTSGMRWVDMNANDKYQAAQQLMAGGANGTAVPLPTALARAKALGWDDAIVRPYLLTFYNH